MAFAIHKQSLREKVAESLKAFVETGSDGNPLKDQSFIESVKADILTDANALDPKFNAVLIIAEGQHLENQRHRTVQVIGQTIHV
jgi:hypothetical protein